jgi:hypothetical protein
MSRNTKTGVTIKKEFVKDKYLEYFLQKETEICYDELVDRVRRLSGEIITNIYDVLKSGNVEREQPSPKQAFTIPIGLERPTTFSFNRQTPHKFENVKPTAFSFNGQPPHAFTFENVIPTFTFNSPPSTFTFGKPPLEKQQSFCIPSKNETSKPTNKVETVFNFEKTNTKPKNIAKKPLDTKVRKFSK